MSPDSAPGSEQPSGPGPGTVSRREERRLATIAEVKAAARRQLAEQGPGGLSLRAIAREMRMAPSALYRYFTNYDHLVGALCEDAYNAVADEMGAACALRPADDHAGRWWALCHAYRRWALDHPPDFTLIFGAPVPGSHVPEPVTGPAAARFVEVHLDVLTEAVRAGAVLPDRAGVPDTVETGPLLDDLLRRSGKECSPRLAAVGLTAWASVLGYLVAEVHGSLRRLIGDTDALFAAHVRSVMLAMGFDRELTDDAAQRLA